METSKQPQIRGTQTTQENDFRPAYLLNPGQWKHPELVEAEKLGNPALTSLKIAHNSLHDSVMSLNEMRKNPNPYKTDAENQRLLEKAIERAMLANAQRTDRARESAKAEIQRVQSKVESYLRETDRASEIRSYIRGRSEGERADIIARAIEAQDKETIAAVLNAPAYLSGLKEDRQQAIKQQYLQKVDPDLIKLERALTRADKLTDEASLESYGDFDRLRNPELAKAARIKAEMAEEALKKVESAYGYTGAAEAE